MSFKPAVIEPRMVKKPPFTVEVSGCPQVEGETIPRRNAKTPDKLLSQPEEGISTLYELVKHSASKFGDQKALGSRNLIKKHHETKKVKKMVNGELQHVDKSWTYFELSEYKYLSYAEYETLTLQLGAGLRKLGLSTPDRVHMFASTSAHWLAIAHGALSQSMAIVTAYDTLGEEGLRHSLVATRAKAIFVEPQLLKTLTNTLKNAKDIKYIILNTDSEHSIQQEDLDILKTSHDYLTVLNFEELRQLGKSNPTPPTPPAPDDLCCIMYTSGSGGTPKGVELKHRNVVAAVAGANTVYGDYLSPDDCLLAYLPLAHILEFVFENLCLYWGATLGYGSPRTLSEANCRNCKGDIQELRPTLMVGIPAIWETVKKGIIANVNRGGRIVETMFWSAFYTKRFLMANGLPGSSMLDSIVFKKVKEATGGRLRFCFNGAAPIARETQEFISLAVTPMVSGYGSTETAAMGALCDPLAWTVDALGGIPSCIEIKLVDFPDAGYYAKNTPNPQGEIWIRGNSITEGYYQNEEETLAAFEDGWFKTGDIGEWDADGHLKVIDRKKNLVKTLNGEYIALEKLESVYRSATVVSNICVYASITETHPIAIIVPAEPALKKLADTIGVKGHGIGDLVYDERIQQEVLRQLQAVGRKALLSGIEVIAGVVLADEEWTPQNNMITATLKLNRRGIFERYQKDIETAYAKNRTR